MNLSLLGVSSLMAPKITALRSVARTHKFDPLLTRKIWWDRKSGDHFVRDRHEQRQTSSLIGYGQARKRKPPTMAPPAENLEKRYRLQTGEGLRMAGMSGQGLRMAGMRGSGLPINLSNPQTMLY